MLVDCRTMKAFILRSHHRFWRKVDCLLCIYLSDFSAKQYDVLFFLKLVPTIYSGKGIPLIYLYVYTNKGEITEILITNKTRIVEKMNRMSKKFSKFEFEIIARTHV